MRSIIIDRRPRAVAGKTYGARRSPTMDSLNLRVPEGKSQGCFHDAPSLVRSEHRLTLNERNAGTMSGERDRGTAEGRDGRPAGRATTGQGLGRRALRAIGTVLGEGLYAAAAMLLLAPSRHTYSLEPRRYRSSRPEPSASDMTVIGAELGHRGRRAPAGTTPFARGDAGVLRHAAGWISEKSPRVNSLARTREQIPSVRARNR